MISLHADLLACPLSSLPMVTRSEWGAQAWKLVEFTNGSEPFVLIHHSYIPGHCNNTDDCKSAVGKTQS